jgi:hypothetical protein
MSTSNRQNTLLIAEDWKKIYTSFRNADFKSYDFDTIRRTMVQYLTENYGETFNDYLESSEYIALIDLIAYVAQSLSFRVDLNARENFLETAERRESVLRLARSIGYQPRRNVPARGLLKINSISTTESVYDSNGTDLSNINVTWNDVTNTNWLEQFTTILNAAFASPQAIGSPLNLGTIGGVRSETYKINTANTTVPAFGFTRNINGIGYDFQLVSSSFKNQNYFYEETPVPGNKFGVQYRNDGRGNSSNNTGFFIMFKQGALNFTDFTITNPVANDTVNIDTNNITQDDIWLFKTNDQGFLQTQWTKVPALAGNSAIYNSLTKNIRTIYSVSTRQNDRITLNFSDGKFGDIPQGTFRAYYRTAANLEYRIKPRDMQGVQVSLSYRNAKGQLNNLTITMSLLNTIENASTSETLADIKNKAPQAYYAQNRMVTAEDYNIVPLLQSQTIKKIKSVNRYASGISRYIDVLDPTGKYSNLNVFAEDGIFYKQDIVDSTSESFLNNIQIGSWITNTLEKEIATNESFNFYYDKYSKVETGNTLYTWNSSTRTNNSQTGYFKFDSNPTPVGTFASQVTSYVSAGALLKFTAPSGFHFMEGGTLMSGAVTHKGAFSELWTSVVNIAGDGQNSGTGNLASGLGPVVLADYVPTNAILSEIVPVFRNSLTTATKTSLLDYFKNNRDFGFRYDRSSSTWKIITAQNLSASSVFSLDYAGDTGLNNKDASWIWKFEYDGTQYNISNRKLRYVFESANENRFYFDDLQKVYDVSTGAVIKDEVKILRSNGDPDTNEAYSLDKQLEIVGNIIESDGYADNRKVRVAPFDTDNDGIPDEPDIFEKIVQPSVNATNKYVFFQKFKDFDNFDRYKPYASTNFEIVQNETSVTLPGSYTNGQLFYFYDADEDVIKKYNSTTNKLVTTTDYIARIGRDDLFFQYKHKAGSDRRLDPAVSNLIDIYVLTNAYDLNFRTWLRTGVNVDGTTAQPVAPTSSSLETAFGTLQNLKSISDTIVWNPVKYKILFGSKAETNLQATFKIVKNREVVVSDNDVKTGVMSAVEEYFDQENFDFGDTFYFTELAAFVHARMAPNLSSVVIVPNNTNLKFGNLFEVRSNVDELFISGLTVSDIDVVTNLDQTTINSASAVSSTATTSTATTSSSSTGSSGSGY